MVVNNIVKKIIISLSLLFALNLYANQDPIVFLEGVTGRVMDSLKKNKDEFKSNPKKMYDMVNKLVIPYVDFNDMAKWIAGRATWSKASAVTKERFLSEFKELVVKTYITALQNYSDEKIQFAPMRVSKNVSRIQVASKIIRTNNEDIRVDYRLLDNKNTWKVYDIIIEGVSILQGFQAQFSNEIKQKGLDAVVSNIKKHNESTKSQKS